MGVAEDVPEGAILITTTTDVTSQIEGIQESGDVPVHMDQCLAVKGVAAEEGTVLVRTTSTDAAVGIFEKSDDVHLDQCSAIKGVAAEEGTLLVKTTDAAHIEGIQESGDGHMDQCLVIQGVPADEGTVLVRTTTGTEAVAT